MDTEELRFYDVEHGLNSLLEDIATYGMSNKEITIACILGSLLLRIKSIEHQLPYNVGDDKTRDLVTSLDIHLGYIRTLEKGVKELGDATKQIGQAVLILIQKVEELENRLKAESSQSIGVEHEV